MSCFGPAQIHALLPPAAQCACQCCLLIASVDGVTNRSLFTCMSCMQELKPKTKIGVSGQFDATDPNTKPKFGFAFDLKN